MSLFPALHGFVSAIQQGSSDPDWDDVTLLCHFDGTDGQTTFTDEKGNTMTGANGARIEQDQSKFGGTSGYFDGDARIDIADDVDFGFGTGSWTWEFWAYPQSGNNAHILDFRETTAAENGVLYWNNYALSYYNGGVYSSGHTLSANTWVHIAVTYDGTTLRFFKDGVKGTDHVTSLDFSANRPLRIAANYASGGEAYTGYIDDLRITKGVARYTSNFTAPTAPYPDQ